MGNRGRGPSRLTVEQEAALNRVDKVDEAWRDAKLSLRAKLRRQLEDEIHRYSLARDEAVYEAVAAGVPKSRIATEGLHTSPNAVYDACDRHAELIGRTNLPGIPERPAALYSWELLRRTHGGTVGIYALHDTTTTNVAEFRNMDEYGEPLEFTVDGGWILVTNGDMTMWFGGTPGADVLKWVAQNPPSM